MTFQIDWSRLNKVSIKEVQDSMTKKLVVKCLLAQRLLIKYSAYKYWLRIYTEHPITPKKTCDLLFINEKTKEAYAFEIHKRVNNKWLKETKELYKEWEMFNIRTGWILIDLNECPNDIDKLKEYLDRQIV